MSSSSPTVSADEQALIDGICLDPDSDAPRLVYADWLDDTRHPLLCARAELIRAQCRMARLPNTEPEYIQLRRRSARLLRLHSHAWDARHVPAGLLARLGARPPSLGPPSAASGRRWGTTGAGCRGTSPRC